MKLTVGRFAELTGVSIRTLRYYDEIGLLKPDEVDGQSGYRFYGEKAFSRMQAILFYRELDFPLKTIAELLSSPHYNKQAALRGQKQLLLLKKARLERIITALEHAERGEEIMLSDAFSHEEIDCTREQYKTEAKQRWGDTAAYQEHVEKTKWYTAAHWSTAGDELEAVIAAFAVARAEGVAPTDEAALALVERLKTVITETQYTCTKAILRCLGQMYVADERFRQNIDRHGDGTAAYMQAAIDAYCAE